MSYQFNLKGIITYGTPHQGAPAATSISNTAYVQSILDQVRDDINAGPEWQSSDGWQGISLGNAIDLILSGTALYNYRDFSTSLSDAHATATRYIKEATSNNASQLAPESAFISNLQPKIYTVPHISISGVENSPTFIRFVSTLNDLGKKLGNEENAVNKLNDAVNGYQTVETYHEYIRWIIWPAFFHYDEGYEKWQKGRIALQSLDAKWAELHNGELLYYTTTVCSRQWVSLNCYGGGSNSVQDLEKLFFEFIPCRDQPEWAAAGGYYTNYCYSYTTFYSDITDGFIPKQKTKWYSDDTFVPQGTAPSAVRQGNMNFNGTGDAYGGYNHGELRYARHNYGNKDWTAPFLYSKLWTSWWINN